MSSETRRLIRRTSITVDEAVAILLGQAGGPIEVQPMQVAEDAEEAEDNRPDFDLEILEDECDVAQGEYNLAKYEKQPEHVIAERLEAFNRQKKILDKAYEHLCAIDDELNKGERSMLRVDVTRTNAAYRYITLHSFTEWQRYRAALREAEPRGAEVVRKDAESAQDETNKSTKKPRDKMRRQERAILDAIEKSGYVAKALPKHTPKEAGAKANVWQVVQNLDLFDNYDIYDKAWERLRKGKDIRDAEPSPHKKS